MRLFGSGGKVMRYEEMDDGTRNEDAVWVFDL